ncbi:hypothetical protein MTO96_031115 [Rhipicephalus appendiculatus]
MANTIDPPENVTEDAVNTAAAAARDTTPRASANDDETSPSNDDGSAWVLVQKKRRTQADLLVSQPKRGTKTSKLKGNTSQRKPTTSRPPSLSLHDYKAILRPLGRLRLDQWARPTLTRAIGVAASITLAEVDRIVFRLRPEQNLAVVSMPHEHIARNLYSVQHLHLGEHTYPVSIYIAAPDDSCKGIVYGVDPGTSPSELMDHLMAESVKRLPSPWTMSACGKLRTFLWRRLFLQTIRRHYLALLVEIVFVFLMFKVFLRIDRVDLADVRKFNSALLEDRNVHRMDVRAVDLSGVLVVYGPSNSRTDKLINKLRGIRNRRRPREKAIHGMHDKYKNYEHVLQPTYRDTTDEMPSNKLIDSLLEYTDDSGDPDGDDIHNDANEPVASKPPYDDIYHEERQIDLRPGMTVTRLMLASAVAGNCSGTISNQLLGKRYEEVIDNIMCIEFASDSANYISTGSLAYNIVLPVPPRFAFPRQVMANLREIIQDPKVLFDD